MGSVGACSGVACPKAALGFWGLGAAHPQRPPPQADYELAPDEKRKEMGEEIIRRFLHQEVSPGGGPWSRTGEQGPGAGPRVPRWLRAHPSPVCSPQSPDYLPEISQAHVSRCLEELQKSPCKELFSSCLQ